MGRRDNDGRWPRGVSGNPAGPTRLDRMVVYDAVQGARKFCAKSIEVLGAALDDPDPKVRILAATALLNRGYGLPAAQANVAVTHAFCVMPETMSKSDWLLSRGQPEVLAQLKAACPNAPTPDDIIELKVEPEKLN
jgi:hypothetical protein